MFEHDTRAALASAAALVNTAPSHHSDNGHPELLPDPDALAAFLEKWGWRGQPPRTHDAVRHVQAVRSQVRQLWTLHLPELVIGINALLAEHRALPRLVRHGQYGWHIHATEDDAPLHARMAVEAAMAMVDLVRADETERLRACASEDCDNVLVDLSRNRSKIYCDISCANRAHAAAYRARQAQS